MGELGRSVVEISDMALAGEHHLAFADDKIETTLLKILRPSLLSGEFDAHVKVVTTNIEEFLAERTLSDDDRKLEIARVVYQFFNSLDDDYIKIGVVSHSLGISEPDTKRGPRYFARSGILRQMDSPHEFCFQLADDGMPRLERLVFGGPPSEQSVSGYFRDVGLAAEFREPYSFVLMPFREQEYPQARYTDLIKPTLMRVTGLNCWRADEKQNQQRITDQIYSQILHAAVIVADVTTLNPNVLLEVGLALANHKTVYIFYDLRESECRRRLFDIGEIPFRGYLSEEELAAKLEEVEIPSSHTTE
jgi:hypothetical protein